MGWPPLGLENFPLKSQNFAFFYFWVNKISSGQGKNTRVNLYFTVGLKGAWIEAHLYP